MRTTNKYIDKEEINTTVKLEVNAYLFEELLSECKTVEIRFDDIDKNLRAIEESTALLERTVDNKEERAISILVDKTYADLKNHLVQITQKLEELKKRSESESNSLDEKESEIIKTKIIAYYTELKSKLTSVHSLYNDFKNRLKVRLVKQVKNIDINNQYQEQEVEKIIDDDPEMLQKIVQQQVFGKASLRMQYAAQDISERCQGIKILQKNIKELLTMLQEISQIVALQGEKINSIAQHCVDAKDNMVNANKNLTEAKKHAKKVRWVL